MTGEKVESLMPLFRLITPLLVMAIGGAGTYILHDITDTLADGLARQEKMQDTVHQIELEVNSIKESVKHIDRVEQKVDNNANVIRNLERQMWRNNIHPQP